MLRYLYILCVFSILFSNLSASATDAIIIGSNQNWELEITAFAPQNQESVGDYIIIKMEDHESIVDCGLDRICPRNRKAQRKTKTV